MAVGYQIGLILDNEKGNSQKAATNGILKLQNIYFADMEILGSDANKLYQDALVTGDANGKPVIDETRSFFSSTFFTAQIGNRSFGSADELKLTGASTKAGVNYLPQTGSPLLGAVSFSDSKLSAGFDKVTYIGAFPGESDNWMNGWTNFDPQNMDY